jgi:methyl-accepting chemotaxis protein
MELGLNMHLTISRKLILLAVTALAGVLLLTVLGQWQMNKVFDATNYANVNTVPSLIDLYEAQGPMMMNRTLVWQHIAQPSKDAKIAIENAIAENDKKIQLGLDKYERSQQ